MQPRVILASRSPARAELLLKLGLKFEIIPAHVDETVGKNESPLTYVRRVARSKALKVAEENLGAIIVAADTPIILGRRILQNPENVEEAEKMLRLQSGRKISIPTVVVVVSADGKVRDKVVLSWIKLKTLKEKEIQAHMASELWQGTAGGLKLEHMEHWVRQTHGSISGIMGLPLYETQLLLRAAGVRV